MLVIGFFLLIVGADMLVKGASNIAQKFHIPEMIIGLTIVAIGTSMPELMITISSAKQNTTDLIIGNAIGSNLCNLLFILGTMAILKPVSIDEETKIIHLPIALISTVVILGIGTGKIGIPFPAIGRVEGISLVTMYCIYFLYPIVIEIKDIVKSVDENKKKHIKFERLFMSFISIIAGVILLKVGGDLVVNDASKIALKYGISESVIGLTIVAIGTALPELITSIIAIIKKEENLAVGNLIGSCILNSYLILGIGAIITPLFFSKEFFYDLVLLSVAIILIWLFCFTRKKDTITRFEGFILLMMFCGYMINLFK